MRKRLRAFSLLSCLLCPFPVLASGLDQLRAFVAETRSARANFSQTVVSKSGRKPQQSEGGFAFARPGKFRWVYAKPYHQVIVGDGEKLWMHDPDLNQVTVKKLGQTLGSSPAALLAGDSTLEKHFVIVNAGRSEELEFINATPKAQDGNFERVRIGFKDNLPQRMEIRDNFGQTTNLQFSRFERNPALAPDLFRFAPPQGADVVGE